jgi:hypothetical protein
MLLLLVWENSLKPLFHVLPVSHVGDPHITGKNKNPEKMIIAKVPLKNAIKEGFQALLKGRDHHVRILIQATEDA